MELDVVFVGAGMANLTAAYRLMRNIESHNERARSEEKNEIDEPTVLVIDKGVEVGSHSLSGAVVDPVAFRELFPDLDDESLPFMTPVVEDHTYYLTPSGKLPVPGPFLPKEMRNAGGYRLASLSEMTRWMAGKCEEVGVEVYTEFAADELLRENGQVVGVRIADKGLDKDGSPGEAYAPGMDLKAKVTVLGEGTRGFLAQQLIADEDLAKDANPQVWGLGLKELIEVPKGRLAKGSVIHTFGYPLDLSTYGGSFIYGLDDNLIGLGLVFGLDYANPLFESHTAFLQFKRHPFVSSLIEGGKVLEYGAKTLPEGGYFALPRLAVDGAVILGDSAGFLNCMRLKGIHLAMKSGMLAANAICRALSKDNFSAAELNYRDSFEASWAGKEMRRARNFRQPYHKGMIPGMMATGLHMITGGAQPGGRLSMPSDCEGLKKASQGKQPPQMPTDDTLHLDLLTDVYKSGAVHREDQAPHCEILDPTLCVKCREEYGMPCTRFCPAKVYEEELDGDGNFKGIQVSFANCVHCKTCEIKDPLKNVRWHPPEGGDGPKYQRM